jgi:RimJ/RimL family protein N-acetyltransferase
MIQPPLKTERLVLREFKEDDWQAVHEYASDPEVVKHMPFGPNTVEDTRAFIDCALGYQFEKPRHHFELAVTLRDGGRLLGGCGIRFTNAADLEASMGYCLHRHFWGNGYATEAGQALLALGFDGLGAHRVFAICAPENVASTRVLIKLGMQREGLLRENMRIADRWRDSFLYAILEHEWRELRA